MIQLKRTSGFTGGFRTSKPSTPYPTPNAAPAASGTPYAAMGFVARCGNGQLLMNYAPAVRLLRRRVPAPA